MSRLWLLWASLLCVCALHSVAIQPEGLGTEEYPYQVDSLENLQWITENTDCWTSWFLQTQDIEAIETMYWNTGAGLMTIGYYNSGSDYCKFRGNYNGMNHTISNLYINCPTTTDVGLFGTTQDAVISDLSLSNVSIHGGSYTGGIIGYSTTTAIQNCSVTGLVIGSGDKVGGMIGVANSTGPIQNCWTDTVVYGNGYVGALLGFSWGATVMNCHALGATHGTGDRVGGLIGTTSNSAITTQCWATGSVDSDGAYNGGLVGNVYNSSVSCCWANCTISGPSHTGGLIGISNGAISECYSIGSVFGGFSTGGLAGFLYGNSVSRCFSTCNVFSSANDSGGLIGCSSNASTVINCYATGNVESESYCAAGLVGSNSGSTIENCYCTGSVSCTDTPCGLVSYRNRDTVSNSFWNTETSGLFDSSGGMGIISAQMRSSNTFTTFGWDFINETTNGTSDYWTINPMANNGFPRLSWQIPPSIESPLNLSIAISNSSVHLSWSDVPNASFYKLYESCDCNAAFPEEWDIVENHLTSTDWTSNEQTAVRKFFRVIAIAE
jgi:hypothetical protein